MNTNAPAKSIIEIFKTCFQQEFGEVLHDVRIVRQWNRGNAQVCLLEFEQNGVVRRMIGKRLCDSQSNQIYADLGHGPYREYLALQTLEDKFTTIPAINVPKPQMSDWDAQCYFLEFIDGPQLDSMMHHLRFYSPRTSLMQLGQVFFQAGTWLHRFQELTGVQYVGRGIFESVVRHCDHRLSQIEELKDVRCPSNLRLTVMRQIEGMLSRVDDVVPVSGCHGDFGPWNMISRGNELTVFDFYTFRKEFVALDATHVLVNLDDQNVAPAFTGRRIANLADSFLRGYAPSTQLDPYALQIAETFYRIYSLHNGLLSKDQQFRERLRNTRLVKRGVSWLTSPGHRTSVWSQLFRYAVHTN